MLVRRPCLVPPRSAIRADPEIASDLELARAKAGGRPEKSKPCAFRQLGDKRPCESTVDASSSAPLDGGSPTFPSPARRAFRPAMTRPRFAPGWNGGHAVFSARRAGERTLDPLVGQARTRAGCDGARGAEPGVPAGTAATRATIYPLRPAVLAARGGRKSTPWGRSPCRPRSCGSSNRRNRSAVRDPTS